jgi:hypothetical protein
MPSNSSSFFGMYSRNPFGAFSPGTEDCVSSPCKILRYNTDLKREYHEIIVSIHLYRILVRSSPNEMLCKALVGDCS